MAGFSLPAELGLPWQNLVVNCSVWFSMAEFSLPGQSLVCQGRVLFDRLEFSLPRQNLVCHGRVQFAMAYFGLPLADFRSSIDSVYLLCMIDFALA